MKKNSNQSIIFIGIVSIFLYIIYCILYKTICANISNSNISYILDLSGWFLYFLCLYTWYKKTKKFIDLYTIFITLYFLFNYGQCLMWGLNIHKASEIGKVLLYDKYRIYNNDIVLAQLLTLISILLFHFGALIAVNCKKKVKNININSGEKKTKAKILITCKILLVFVIPITYYIQYKKMAASINSGYYSLFTGELSFGYLSLIARLFFPCIYGLMFASDFNKKVVYKSYIIIFIYFVFSLIIGSRANIVYELLILIYLHHKYVNKINFKNFAIYSIAFIILMSAMSSIRNIRDYGITIDSFKDSFSINNNVITDSFFEMGGTMSVQTIIIQKGNNIYPYGNTYLLGLLGIVTDKTIKLFIPEYMDLSTWFSEKYLKLTYGAGFSIVGEALINFGPYIAPIIMALFGYVIVKVCNIAENDTCKKKILALISFHSFVMFIRGTFGYYIKEWFFTMIILYISYFIVNMFVNYRKGGKISYEE